MKHQSLEILQHREIGDGGDGVGGEIKMLQMNVLVEVLDILDVVVGQTEPGQQVDVLQTLDAHQVVTRKIKNLEIGQITIGQYLSHLEMMKLGHLEHPHQLVVGGRQLQI